MGGEVTVAQVPLPQRVNSKIEEIKKAQSATRIEVETIVKVLYPEALHDDKAKLEEAVAKNPPTDGWFGKAADDLRVVLRFENEIASILRRLRRAIEPQGGPRKEVEQIAVDLNLK